MIFAEQKELPNCPQKIIQFAVNDWLHSINCVMANSTKIQVELAWVHPGIGAFKLNVDGTCKPWSGAIGAGGVIRDSMGDWIGGFSVNLGTGQILEAELWGLFFGLQLAVV